jgi:hypothetical protein
MFHFLGAAWNVAIGILSLFCWIPMVWLIVKLVQWQRDQEDKKREEREEILRNL